MEKRSHRFQDQDHDEQGEGAAQRGKGGEAGGVEQEQGVEQEVRKGGNGGGVAKTAERGGPWFGGMHIHKNITNVTLRTLIGASQ